MDRAQKIKGDAGEAGGVWGEPWSQLEEPRVEGALQAVPDAEDGDDALPSPEVLLSRVSCLGALQVDSEERRPEPDRISCARLEPCFAR